MTKREENGSTIRTFWSKNGKIIAFTHSIIPDFSISFHVRHVKLFAFIKRALSDVFFCFPCLAKQIKTRKKLICQKPVFNDEVKNFAFDLTISNCLFQKSERPNTFFGLSLG
ncbi:protein of unknown function [Ruminococcaceae bacterium BL-6]|nr:protein of unknown function [Ruminococcaceae bacterium BL-6]